ncbi:MAG TPA: DUF202 domain-containing protein [Actinomycetota bacterium]|nr:DUF202 domain-containing protein [Actinomycetota bacterium]
MNGDRREPDCRFSLANERTLLAWIRTALALDAAGLGRRPVRPAPRRRLRPRGHRRRPRPPRRRQRLDRPPPLPGHRPGHACRRPLPEHAAPRYLAAALAAVSVVVLVLLAVDQAS